MRGAAVSGSPPTTPVGHRLRRIAARLRSVSKGSARFIAILAALGVVWAFYSQVKEIRAELGSLNWREGAYSKLASVRAGYSEAHAESVFGVPAISQQLGESGYTSHVFALREHWVKTVVDPAGTILSYSVTACSEEFHPTFDIGEGTVTLQSRPISQAVAIEDPGEAAMIAPDAWFAAWNPTRSNDSYLEYTQSSGASGVRAYLLGTTSYLCTDNWSSDDLLTVPGYDGSVLDSPDEISRWRGHVSANTFGEIWGVDPLFDDATGMVDFSTPDGQPHCSSRSAACDAPAVQPYLLPAGVRAGTTRLFE
jgi:hypothetical protein